MTKRIYDAVYGHIVKCPRCAKILRIRRNQTGPMICKCKRQFYVRKGRVEKGKSEVREVTP